MRAWPRSIPRIKDAPWHVHSSGRRRCWSSLIHDVNTESHEKHAGGTPPRGGLPFCDMHEMRTNRRPPAHSLLLGLIICTGPGSAVADEIPVANANPPDLYGPSECQSSDSDWFVVELADVHITESLGG